MQNHEPCYPGTSCNSASTWSNSVSWAELEVKEAPKISCQAPNQDIVLQKAQCSLQKSIAAGISILVHQYPRDHSKMRRVSPLNLTRNNHEELVNKKHNITPPERTNSFSFMRGSAIGIKTLPGQGNPWEIHLVIELVYIFKKQSCIVCPQIHYSQTPFLFASTHSRPGNEIASFFLNIPSMPKNMLSITINQNLYGNFQCAHVNGWQSRKH